jgi:hypothetical protein
MIDEKQAKEILDSIELTGGITSAKTVKSNPIIIGAHNNIGPIMQLGSGLPKIRKDKVTEFSLILSQPLAIQSIPRHDIRCCLCQEIIYFPCWYYSIRYAVNQFHYFVCFDASNSQSVTARCYRRE